MFLLFGAGGMAYGGETDQAATAPVVARGSAVVAGDQLGARQAAVDDALDRALRQYVYDQLLISHDRDAQLEEQIFKLKDRYILSYEIVSSRRLGDLFQVELLVRINRQLLQRELSSLVKREKEPVHQVVLVVSSAAAGRRQEAPAGEEQLLTAPLLEPRRLAAELAGEMSAYGYDFSLVDEVPGEVAGLCRQSDGLDEGALPGAEGQGISAADCRSRLPGDLAIIVCLEPLVEKRIATVDKLLLESRYRFLLVDMKNDLRSRPVADKVQVLSGDFPAAFASLQQQLLARLHEQIMTRVLDEYPVATRQETTVTLRCTGFRRAADFASFRQRLTALRTVKAATVTALAAGELELRVVTIANYDLLLQWLNHFVPAERDYRLRAALDSQSPGLILVQVDYAAVGLQ
ncbi:MAG: hypothetical protein JRJ56_03895 [Deltaproteobacteria bacterium]|nr:hypothetical protein [Deltaproteobacteria bacterium]